MGAKSPLTKVRKLIRNPVRRVRIVRLANLAWGKNSEDALEVTRSSDLTRDENRGKKRKNGEARIRHERDMFVILIKYLGLLDPVLAICIFLHDLYEDNRRKWPLYIIKKLFGDEVKHVVWAVSKPRMTDEELVSAEGSWKVAERVRKGGRLAMILKVIDRFHFFLKPYPKQKQDRRRLVWKVAQTMQFIQQMALEVGVLSIELQLIVAECVRKNEITTEEISEFIYKPRDTVEFV